MSLTLAEKNSLLRDAVSERLARKLHHEEPDVLRPVTPSGLGTSDEVSSKVDWDRVADVPYIEHLLEQHRLRGDGITHTQPTTSQRFLDLLDEMRRLHESKSADYGSETDPLANIRQGAEFVGIEPWRGCMVRIADKVQRLKTFCRTGRLVHEGVRDTLLDLSAYSLLAIVLFDEGNVDG
jgi:hypothetical protein